MNNENEVKRELVYIQIDKLHPHPDNPRKDLGDLSELADSIKAKGVMQNLTVVPRANGGYTIIIGHRRTAAAKLAGLTELPCIIADLTPREQVLIMMTENMQRSDLTVYEQATCMQTMMELGESVESISEQTGFSKTTVRRRLDIAKLDKGKLKEVSQRQLSLTDFDELAKLDDVKVRNEILPFMGTSEFSMKLKNAMHTQLVKKKKPLAKKMLESIGATEGPQSMSWSSEFEKIKTVPLKEWDDVSPLIGQDEKRKLYFFIQEYNLELGIYVKVPKAKPVQKTEAEKQKKKALSEAWDSAEKLAQLTYELRCEFMEKFTMTKENQEAVFRGAVLTVGLAAICYSYGESSDIKKIIGFEESKGYDTTEKYRAMQKLIETDRKLFPKIIYAGFDDSTRVNFTGTKSKYSFPKYEKNAKLTTLYAWLEMLGYEMSEEEKALRDGTHEIFKQGERE